MKTNQLTSLALGVLLAVAAPLALANKMPDNAMQMSKVLESLKSKGFSVVTKIEYDNGMYVAKVVNNEGKDVKIHFNAQSGEIVKPKETVEEMTALDVAKKVEAAGYTNIYKIDTKLLGSKYEVKAFKNGAKTELDVDAKTGNILNAK